MGSTYHVIPTTSLAVRASRIYTPHTVIKDGVVVIRDGKISYVGQDTGMGSGCKLLEFPGGICAPGFIDLHVHGGGGGDFADGNPESIRRACAFHARGGTTSLLATLMSEPLDRMIRAVEAIRPYVGRGTGGSEILGVHLEGPFLNPEMSRAHPRDYLRLPRGEVVERLLGYADVVRRVTIAPELEGGIRAVRLFSCAGMLVSIGHSNAEYGVVRRAFIAGLRHATHLYNGMGRAFKRGAYRVPGTLESVLALDGITAEIIADGRHVHPALIRLAVKAKGYENLCLVTDAMRAAGMPDGRYKLGSLGSGVEVVVRGGISYLADGSSFAGTTISMVDAVRVMAGLGYPLDKVFVMASTVPARVLGLGSKKGVLRPGLDGDLVVLDENLNVLLTVVKGRVVYARSQLKDIL